MHCNWIMVNIEVALYIGTMCHCRRLTWIFFIFLLSKQSNWFVFCIFLCFVFCHLTWISFIFLLSERSNWLLIGPLLSHALSEGCGGLYIAADWWLFCILYSKCCSAGSRALTSGYLRGVVVRAKLSHAKGDLHTNLSSPPVLVSGHPHFCLVFRLDSRF